jgi:hypothetical protein
MIRAAAALAVIAALGACGQEAPISAESRRREAFVRGLAEREHLLEVWSLMSRVDLVFVEGLSDVDMIDPGEPMHPWTQVARACTTATARPVRWMAPRVLIRVRGDGDQRLVLRGHVDVARLFTRPRVTVTFDGAEVWSQRVDADGGFAVDQVIPRPWLDGWSDVYVTLSSVAEPWRDAADLKIARLEAVAWEPVAARSDPGTGP